MLTSKFGINIGGGLYPTLVQEKEEVRLNWEQFINTPLNQGETSKFTTDSHKLLQGDVGELFLRFLRHVTKGHYYYL